MPKVRVAASQYNTGRDVQENLDKLLAVIDQAAAGGARLVASPEFVNHCSQWPSAEYCWNVALELDGEFVKAVQQKAKQHHIYVVFNGTIRAEFPKVWDSNIFIGPHGELLGTTSKQVLIGTENDFCTPGQADAIIFETELGRVGLYSCMDGVIPETTRVLALKGAQVLVNTLNSMAPDEAALHIPVRAAENHVWVVAANKSGPMHPEDTLRAVAARLNIPPHMMLAPGEAQIIAPSGELVATGGFQVDDVVFADIEPELADDKSWADGDLLADRRPRAYAAVASSARPDPAEPGPGPVIVAALQVRHDRGPEGTLTRALDLAGHAVDEGAQLIVLPELFAFDLPWVAANPGRAADFSRTVRDRMAQLTSQRDCYVAYSAVDGMGSEFRHVGALIGPRGRVLGEYHQVHQTRGMGAWASPGERFEVWNTPIGRLGMMLGYDGVFPETATALARMGADIILYPTTWRLAWEVEKGILERAAENHISIVSSARWDSPIHRGSLIIPTTHTPRHFDGDLNPVRPVEVPPGYETYVSVSIEPTWSRNKEISPRTDLLKSRRPELYGAIVATA